LGTKYLVVLCAGSTLPLAKQSLDEAPYKLSGAVAKLAGITFWSLAFSWIRLNLSFLLREKLADVLIIPSSWGSQLDGDLHQHTVPHQSSSKIKWDAQGKGGRAAPRAWICLLSGLPAPHTAAPDSPFGIA
jgi:hypothetical protein